MCSKLLQYISACCIHHGDGEIQILQYVSIDRAAGDVVGTTADQNILIAHSSRMIYHSVSSSGSIATGAAFTDGLVIVAALHLIPAIVRPADDIAINLNATVGRSTTRSVDCHDGDGGSQTQAVVDDEIASFRTDIALRLAITDLLERVRILHLVPARDIPAQQAASLIYRIGECGVIKFGCGYHTNYNAPA